MKQHDFQLERKNGVDLLRFTGAPALPLDLVFSTRRGGTSFMRGDLNLSRGTGDTDVNVFENRSRFFGSIGAEAGNTAILRQVHGNRIVNPGSAPVTDFNQRREKADGLVTSETDLWLSISIGDCVPVCLFHPPRRVLAMLHSGWRSTVKKISARAVELLSDEYQCPPGELMAVIGPGISAAHYQVDEPVISAFQREFSNVDESLLDSADGKAFLNIEAAVTMTLVESGVEAANIRRVNLCSHTLQSLFFSHRRDGLPGGRMLALGRIRA